MKRKYCKHSESVNDLKTSFILFLIKLFLWRKIIQQILFIYYIVSSDEYVEKKIQPLMSTIAKWKNSKIYRNNLKYNVHFFEHLVTVIYGKKIKKTFII